jgi:hypothetical protein
MYFNIYPQLCNNSGGGYEDNYCKKVECLFHCEMCSYPGCVEESGYRVDDLWHCLECATELESSRGGEEQIESSNRVSSDRGF